MRLYPNNSAGAKSLPEGAFYLTVRQDRFGQYYFGYSRVLGRDWIRLMPITAEQAGWMIADGWKVEKDK